MHAGNQPTQIVGAFDVVKKVRRNVLLAISLHLTFTTEVTPLIDGTRATPGVIISIPVPSV